LDRISLIGSIMDKLTIDKAISKGHQMVNYPVIGILIIGPIFSVFLAAYYQTGWFHFGIVLSILGAWFYWSAMITKWRIFAFGNCRNVHELKRRAINEKLIWPDGSWFEKTEIRSFLHKEKLKQIQKKFKIQDELELYDDDGSIPQESIIYYSKVSLRTLWGLGLIMFGVALYWIIFDNLLYGCFILIPALYILYEADNKSKIKDPYIIINSKGIKLLNSRFISWKNIDEVNRELKGSGKNSKWLLRIWVRDTNKNKVYCEEIAISDLDLPTKKILRRVNIHRQRYRIKNTGLDN